MSPLRKHTQVFSHLVVDSVDDIYGYIDFVRKRKQRAQANKLWMPRRCAHNCESVNGNRRRSDELPWRAFAVKSGELLFSFRPRALTNVFERDGFKCTGCGAACSLITLEYEANQLGRAQIDGTINYYVLKRDGIPSNLSDYEMLTIDHVIPKAHGGKNDYGNYASMCFACNQAKGATFPTQESTILKTNDAAKSTRSDVSMAPLASGEAIACDLIGEQCVYMGSPAYIRTISRLGKEIHATVEVPHTGELTEVPLSKIRMPQRIEHPRVTNVIDIAKR